MRTVAVYDFAQWYDNVDHVYDMHVSLQLPYKLPIVPYQDADIIIIFYGGNGDKVPFIQSLLEQFPKKIFIFVIGENLFRSQPIIPKKISHKASVRKWARKIFPYIYIPSHKLFPHPRYWGDIEMHKLLRSHRDNPQILVLATHLPEDLGKHEIFYPLFYRTVLSHTIASKYFTKETSQKERHIQIKNILSKLHPDVRTNDTNRDVFCSAIFTNTTRERIEAYNSLSKINKVEVYGENPISFTKHQGNVKNVYLKSRFVICFESSIAEGYITEKLFTVMQGKSIPLYWGAPEIANYCNTKAMVICKTLQEIKALNTVVQDKEEYFSQFNGQAYFLPENIDLLINTYETMREKLIHTIES